MLSNEKDLYSQQLDNLTYQEIVQLKKQNPGLRVYGKQNKANIIKSLLRKYEKDLTKDAEPNLQFRHNSLPESTRVRTALVVGEKLSEYARRDYNSNISGNIGLMAEIKENIEKKAKELKKIFASFENAKSNRQYNRVVDDYCKSIGIPFKNFTLEFRKKYFNSNGVHDKLFTNDIKTTNADKLTDYNYLSILSDIINKKYANKPDILLEDKLAYFLYDIFNIITKGAIKQRETITPPSPNIYTGTFEYNLDLLKKEIKEIIKYIELYESVKSSGITGDLLNAFNPNYFITEIKNIYTKNIEVILYDIKLIITEFKQFDLHINPLYNDIVSLNETIEEYLTIIKINKEIIKFDLITEIKDAFLNQNIILAKGKQSRTRKKKLKKKIKSKKDKRKKENI
tara:strand:- start:1804 stop:2997 length:1194 start_codon:yes stop_codon:yes gene_type:complete